MKLETVGMLEWGQADQGHQMDGVVGVVVVGANGADQEGLGGQAACMESLVWALKLTEFWEHLGGNLRLSVWKYSVATNEVPRLFVHCTCLHKVCVYTCKGQVDNCVSNPYNSSLPRPLSSRRPSVWMGLLENYLSFPDPNAGRLPWECQLIPKESPLKLASGENLITPLISFIGLLTFFINFIINHSVTYWDI